MLLWNFVLLTNLYLLVHWLALDLSNWWLCFGINLGCFVKSFPMHQQISCLSKAIPVYYPNYEIIWSPKNHSIIRTFPSLFLLNNRWSIIMSEHRSSVINHWGFRELLIKSYNSYMRNQKNGLQANNAQQKIFS